MLGRHQTHLVLVLPVGLRLGLKPVLLRRLARGLLLRDAALLLAKFVLEFDVLLIAIGEVRHVPVVQLLTHEAGADAVLGVRADRL